MRLVADIGEGRTMRISGPFSFDNEGYLSGQFKLEIEKLDAWSDNAKQAFPQLQSTIDTARKMLRALMRRRRQGVRRPRGGSRPRHRQRFHSAGEDPADLTESFCKKHLSGILNF